MIDETAVSSALSASRVSTACLLRPQPAQQLPWYRRQSHLAALVTAMKMRTRTASAPEEPSSATAAQGVQQRRYGHQRRNRSNHTVVLHSTCVRRDEAVADVALRHFVGIRRPRGAVARLERDAGESQRLQRTYMRHLRVSSSASSRAHRSPWPRRTVSRTSTSRREGMTSRSSSGEPQSLAANMPANDRSDTRRPIVSHD
jgi:hypothetical protein